MKRWTAAAVLTAAAHHDFYVSKYRWGHEALRKRTRRMLKEGALILVRVDRDYFYYRKAP